jgi:protein O-GlcNAc transferase
MTVTEAFQQARTHHQAGRVREAESLYRSILQTQPGHPNANHNLGVIELQAGHVAAAIPHFSAALAADSSQAQFWFSYIAGLIAAGKNDDARQAFEQARQRGLDGPQMDVLGARLSEAAKPPEQPGPNDVQALLELFHAGRYEEVVTAARAMTGRFPLWPFGWKILGPALMQLRRTTEALGPMQTAAELSPNDAQTHHNLSTTLKKLGRLADAEGSCRRALAIKPEFFEAHLNLGSVMYLSGHYDDAIACCRRALELVPDAAEAHFNLGNALRQKDQDEQAIASYRRALEIKPDFAEVLSVLGTIMHDQGLHEEAMAIHRRALALQPNVLRHEFQIRLALPAIPESTAALARARERYEAGIVALAEIPGALDDNEVQPQHHSFYLAYQNGDDRPLMEATSNLMRTKWRELGVISPHLSRWRSPLSEGRRIRIGLLSPFLVGHTIGKLYQGLIQHLDRRRFEVFLLQPPETKSDGLSRYLGAQVEQVIALPVQLQQQQRAVMAAELDVLFYPDIGMAASTYFLGHGRLAPVQAVSWGHPVTTGLNTIDYFVSASSVEPIDADTHYTERLIRLNRLPCFYQPFVVPREIPDRAKLNLPAVGTLYGCPQSLFKFHPDFDHVLASIAEGDPAGRLVLLDPVHPAWKAQLKDRWERTAPILLERTIFLPRLPLGAFMELLANLDVLLDPIYFGSGNTLYEAMVFGIPIVTWPGPFMRGRIVAGAYAQMGITGAPIASRLEDYAATALALAKDPARVQCLKRKLREGAQRELFLDLRAVREFETFLTAAVNAAAMGTTLPPAWRPDSPASLT